MAPRSVAEDQIQSFRFRVFEVEGGAGVFAEEVPVAGFNTVTTPNLTIEQAEHRTGAEKYTRKFPGVPTWEDCTMTRGILYQDTTFYNWAINKYTPFMTNNVRNTSGLLMTVGTSFGLSDRIALTLRTSFFKTCSNKNSNP